MEKSKQIQKEYDSTAEIYNSRYSGIQAIKYQKALKDIELGGKILDLGSGTGLLQKFLQMDLIGVDISFNMLLQGRCKSVQAVAEELPFKSGSFDYVLSFSALMNFENPEQALKEVKRILKPKGSFVCSYLKKFNFEEILKKHFKIIDQRDCGEDIVFFLR